MSKLNIYHRRDGRWEGRIFRGKRMENVSISMSLPEQETLLSRKWKIFAEVSYQKDDALKQYLHCFWSGIVVFSIESRNLPSQTIR